MAWAPSRRRGGRRAAGEGQEHVVEVGGPDRQPVDLDRRGVEPVEQRAQRVDAAVARQLEREPLLVARAVAERAGGRSSSAASPNSSRTLPPGTSRLSSAGVPWATTRPPSSSAIRSASRSASSRYWVVRRIVTPSATRSRMMSHITRRLRGSRPVVGSSRKMIRGSPTSVIARSSRRRMPPEYVIAGLAAASTRSNRSSSSATRCRPAPRRGGGGRPSGAGSPRR